MKKHIKLPPELEAGLRREADRLEVDVDFLLAGLVKSFLDKQDRPSCFCPEKNAPTTPNRRAHSRTRVNASALLHFQAGGGKAALYKAGELKDMAPGGVCIECDKTFPVEDVIAAGRRFVLIFQVRADEPPLRLPCELRRVDQGSYKTMLGVIFTGQDNKTVADALRLLAQEEA